jgi:hypothetical protein
LNKKVSNFYGFLEIKRWWKFNFEDICDPQRYDVSNTCSGNECSNAYEVSECCVGTESTEKNKVFFDHKYEKIFSCFVFNEAINQNTIIY